MAAGRRTKRKLKNSPKHRQARALKARKRNAKFKSSRKRGLNRAKARRRAR